MITLVASREFKCPVIADCITPNVFQDKKPTEIRELTLWEGNQQRKLGELFSVEETQTNENLGNDVIVIRGDAGKVRRIGSSMSRGVIIVKGNVGMHLGEEMKAGKITVYGNVGAWAGSMMKGGIIEIHGNASDYLGAPYRGSNKGMAGGKIIVHGNVGCEAGAHMRKGVIKVYGDAGQFVGFRMKNGTIYVQNNCNGRAGACMTEGTIIIAGSMEEVLPTFTIEAIKNKAKVEEGEVIETPFYLFVGDLTESGKGKLYVSKEKNEQLSRFERLL